MSRSAPFQLVRPDAAHDRAAFRSASEPLNRYLREQATQDIRRRAAACFVALADGQRIAGYYTLASASLLLADLPASIGKKLPRYPAVPAVRLGRLAVDQSFAGQGLGAALLGRCIRPCRPTRDCRPCPDGGRQGRGRTSLLSPPRLHRPARSTAHPVLAAGDTPTRGPLMRHGAGEMGCAARHGDCRDMPARARPRTACAALRSPAHTCPARMAPSLRAGAIAF